MYCCQCGVKLAEQKLDGRPRLVCPGCGWVRYPQLKVGAGVLLQMEDQLLLVRRRADADAFAGTWGLPAGYCEVDEPPPATAAREAAEETGFEVSATDLVDAYYFCDDPRGSGILLVYDAEIRGSGLGVELEQSPASDEIDAVGSFPADGLPEPLCGGGHDRALEAWRQRVLDRWEPGVPLRFCPHCSRPVKEELAFGRLRPVCTTCGFVHFREPKVGVSVLVEQGGQVLLVQRAVEPGKGRWSLPSGFLEWDETPEAAVLRECEEESGLELSSLELLEVVHYRDDYRGPGVSLLYRGVVAGGALRAGDDAAAVRFFAPEELPPLKSIAFRGHRRVLEHWLTARASQRRPGLDG